MSIAILARSEILKCPLLVLSGHQLVRCTCPLLTQSGRRLLHRTCLLSELKRAFKLCFEIATAIATERGRAGQNWLGKDAKALRVKTNNQSER